MFVNLTLGGVWGVVRLGEFELFNLELELVKETQLFLGLVIMVRVFILSYSRYYIYLEFRFRYYLIMMVGFMVRIVSLLISANWSILVLS